MATSSFTINPAALLGKLHKAAISKIVEKWGKKVEIANTAIDMSDKNNPLGVLDSGNYQIICTINDPDEFKNEDAKFEPFVTYLTWFAGADVAKKVSKKGNWFKRLFGKGKSELEQSKVGENTYAIPFSLNVDSGTKQSDEEALETQSEQQTERAAREENGENGENAQTEPADTDKPLTTTEKKRVESVIDSVANSRETVDEKNFPKIVDALYNISRSQKSMTKDDMVASMRAIKNMLGKIHLTESITVNEDTSGKLKRLLQRVKNFRRKDEFGAIENEKEPFDSLYEVYKPAMNAQENDLIDLNDDYIKDERQMIMRFAADLHAIAKLCIKKIHAGKVKVGAKEIPSEEAPTDKGSETPANEATEFFGESVSISFSFPFLTESLSFNPTTHYGFVKHQLLKESMKKNAEKLIKNISKKNFTEAHKVLEELIQQKMNARVEDVLSSQKK